MKNIVTRSLAGIVYVAIILLAILLGHYGIYALAVVMTILATNEFLRLCTGEPQTSIERAAKVLTVFTNIGLVTLMPLYVVIGALRSNPLLEYLAYPVAALAAAAPLCLVARLILTLFDKREGALKRVSMSLMSLVYIALPLGCMVVLGLGLDVYPVLILFVMIWLNDTGAYCVGSKFGRRRLFERLSPKKSWEGFWGGFAFSVLAGVVFGLLTCKTYFGPIYPASTLVVYALVWAGAGAVVSIAATLGDLFESLIKRTVGVKDSGTLIPGHGGILDRIDSLLFAAPVLLIYLFVAILIVGACGLR